ncbi:transcription factor IIA, alpha/beta subunit [Trichoderma barbatum]
MSNQAVGNVYQTIIEEVINSSRVDFEESGVEEAVLEELRLGWQQKLSQLDVARFPWDPKPEPAPPAASVPPPNTVTPVQAQAQFSAPLSLPTGSPPSGLPQNGIKQEPYVKAEPGIKQEPGTQQPGIPYQNYNGLENKNSVAANRAAQQLQLQYGVRAAGSINAIQDRMGQQPQMQQQQPGQGPVLPQQQVPHLSDQQSMGNAQLDGAGDDMMEDSDDEDEETFEGVLLRNGINGKPEELGRVDIDRILHDQMAAKAKSMEGGGLMLSLKEATKNQSKTSAGKKPRSKGKAPAGVAAYDGGDDDEEIDEDAINSDLDDPDEDRDDDEVDDEGLGHIMLCMYDKVQRVKNKWKCTLKDGVLTVNGKEYVFNKATGEYEW